MKVRGGNHSGSCSTKQSENLTTNTGRNRGLNVDRASALFERKGATLNRKCIVGNPSEKGGSQYPTSTVRRKESFLSKEQEGSEKKGRRLLRADN